QVQKISSELRAGPLFILGEAQQKIKQNTEAKITWMKIPILYPEKRTLAATALFRCASMLENESNVSTVAGHQALKLWRELTRNHPASQFFELANSKLEN
ncbi:MAG: hypothetical protein AAGA30_11710, partial [Planctomycetota bacterium]